MKQGKRLLTIVMTVVMLITVLPAFNYEVKADANYKNTVVLWQGKQWTFTLKNTGYKIGTINGNNLGNSFDRDNATATISGKTLTITAKNGVTGNEHFYIWNVDSKGKAKTNLRDVTVQIKETPMLRTNNYASNSSSQITTTTSAGTETKDVDVYVYRGEAVTIPLTGTGYYTNQTVSSSNNSIATVTNGSNNITIRGVTAGTTTINAVRTSNYTQSNTESTLTTVSKALRYRVTVLEKPDFDFTLNGTSASSVKINPSTTTSLSLGVSKYNLGNRGKYSISVIGKAVNGVSATSPETGDSTKITVNEQFTSYLKDNDVKLTFRLEIMKENDDAANYWRNWKQSNYTMSKELAVKYSDKETGPGDYYIDIHDQNNAVTGTDGVVSIYDKYYSYLYFSVEPNAEKVLKGYGIKSLSKPTIADESIATVVEGKPSYYEMANIKTSNPNAKYYVDQSGKPGITTMTVTATDNDNVERKRTYTLIHSTTHVNELNIDDINLYVDAEDVSGTHNKSRVELNATDENQEKVYFGVDDITFNGSNVYDGKHVSISMGSDGRYYVTAKSYGTEQVEMIYNNLAGYFTMVPDEDGNLVGVTYKSIVKTVNINILENISSIRFPKKSISSAVGKTVKQSFITVPESKVTDQFVWTSSDPTVAMVDENGNVTTLSAGTTEITVKSLDERGASASYTLNVKSPIVENIKTSNKEDGIEISWKKDPEAASYNIYRSTNNNGNFKLIGSTTTAFYIDTDVAFGNKYYYRVTAIAEGGSSYESNYSETSLIQRKPMTPSIQSITKVGSLYRITISGALSDGFAIYGGMNKNTTVQKCVVNKKQADVTFFKNGFYKYIRVRAYAVRNGTTYYSDYSEPYEYNGTASAKATVKKAKLKGKKLTLRIKKVTNADGYKVAVYKKKKKKAVVYRKSIKKNKKTLRSPKLKKGYYVRVRAYVKINGVTKYGKWSSYKKIK